MNATPRTISVGRRPRGMSLVEVMIAMTVALLVIGVVVTVFAGTSRNRGDLERSSRLAENLSYAMEVLSDDLRQAGWYGEINFGGELSPAGTLPTWQAPDPCGTAMPFGFVAPLLPGGSFQAPIGVRTYRHDEAAPPCIEAVGQRLANTGFFTVRHVAPQTTPIASAQNAPFIQVSACLTAPPETWVIGNTPAAFTMRKLDCATPADVRQLFVRTYFISRCNDCGRDTTPTLKVAELTAAGITITPLVEGIEDMQIEYAFDFLPAGLARDGAPDPRPGDADATRTFTEIRCEVGVAPQNDCSNIVAARVYLLARSADVEPGYRNSTRQVFLGRDLGWVTVPDDGFKRMSEARTIRIMNVAQRREKP
jgi:type IV pilus assembly protein PilW